jgi:chromosome segregation ATPase
VGYNHINSSILGSGLLRNQGAAMSKDLTQKLNGSLEEKIDRLIGAVQSMDSRLANVLANIENRLETLENRLETLENRVESLEIKVEERMKETRPIWEALQTQLAELKESHHLQFTELKESQEKGFRRFDRVMDLVAGDQTRLHGDHVELESRVYKIEKCLNS